MDRKPTHPYMRKHTIDRLTCPDCEEILEYKTVPFAAGESFHCSCSVWYHDVGHPYTWKRLAKSNGKCPNCGGGWEDGTGSPSCPYSHSRLSSVGGKP